MSMASVTDDTPLDPDDERLVAYLDGELPRRERTDLENQLLDDPVLRSRLQQLQSGWDMLEALPDPTPSTKLVETTLELAVADLAKFVPKRSSILSRYRYPIMLFGACLIAMLLAFVAADLMRRYELERQLGDLAIAESMDAYEVAGDLKLMGQLARDPQWNQMIAVARQLDGWPDFQNDEAEQAIASVPIDEREDAIEDLSIDRRTRLSSRWDRFQRLDTVTRQEIKAVADVVSQQVDKDLLLATMRSYALWRERLPPEVIDSIKNTQGDQRDTVIANAIDETLRAMSQRAGRNLSEDAIEVIYSALINILQARLASLPPEQQEIFQDYKSQIDDDRDPYWDPLDLMFTNRDSSRRRFIPPSVKEILELIKSCDQPLQPNELKVILMGLMVFAPDDLATLERSTGGDEMLKSMMIRIWAEEAIRRRSRWARSRDETPLKKYIQMDPGRRDELDLLPPQEILERLERSWGRFSG